MRDTERERQSETQAEGEAGFMQGAQHGTRSRVSRITLWAEGRTKPLSHPGIPFAVQFFTEYYILRAALVAQRFSAAFNPRRDPGDLGLSPTSDSLHGAYFSLCLCLCFSLCVSHE